MTHPVTPPETGGSDKTDETQSYPADKARQGYIVLNTPLRKKIFFGGLIGIAVLVIILAGISIGSA